MKKIEEKWGIKQMFEYACVKYEYDNPQLVRIGCERKIRRTIKDLNWVKKEKNAKNLKYKLPVHKAKALIDTWLKSYFEEVSYEPNVKNFNKKDAILNEQSLKALEEYDPNSLTCDLPPEKEINDSIDRMMLRAIFDIFYEFDEKSYRDDYIKRHSLVIPEDTQPYLSGYFQVNERLENPLKNYCVKKSKS